VASPPNTTTKDNTTEETAGLEKGEVVEPEEPSTAMEQDKLEPIPKTDSSEPMQLVTEKEEPEAAVKQEPGTKHEQDSASSISLQPPPPPPPPSKSLEDGEKEEGETTTDAEPTVNMTQEQIVERIDDIENQISTYEEMLEAAIKREEEEASSSAAAITTTTQVDDEDVEMADDEDETAEEEASQNKAEAKKQALQAMENEPNSSSTDVMDFTDATSPIMRKRPQLLINQLRAKNDHLDDELYEKILQDNRQVAKQNTSEGLWQGHKENMEDWIDEEKWSKPLYSRLEDYPCYKENIAQFEQLRISVAHTMHTQHVALQNKERFLKKEFKALYNQWNDKNLALDRVRMHERKGSDKYGGHRTSSRRREEPEEYTDNVIFTSGAPDALRFKADGASTPHGLYTSDAARSEAELLEIIQSLESAEMRNPETRAKKTTATIPPMILDVRERMRTYDDRSGLVEDPLTYYHTGPDTGDVWNQQEVTTFMESYMMYPKQFERISIAIGTKTACQCVLFYYRKKKKIDFKALMKKGRRGKTTKHRDRIAAAIRAVTGDSASTTRKAKSKGSALMTDIGEAQVSRMAKEKDAERKSRELRDLEQANAYWDGVAERKKTKRPSSSNVTSNSASSVNVPPMSTPIVYPGQNDYNSNVLSRGSVIANSAPSSSASDDTEMMLQQQQLQQQQQEKRRTNSGSLVTGQQRRKGRLPREPAQPPTDVVIVLPSEPTATKKYVADEFMDTTADDSSASVVSSSTKWTEREKEIVIEAFKQYGRDFTQVSSLVHTKTEDQCRNFYHNFKRKYGPNAFNEEDGRASATAATESAPSQQPRPPIQTAPAAIVHDEVVALSGRTDLKAEEEDAAAALVGMFQMGANTTPREESAKNPLLTSRSRTPSSGQQLQEDLVRTQTVSATPTAASATVSAGPSSPITSSPYVPPTQQQQQQQRRRRVRSTSSRAESATGGEDSASSDWTAADADYGGPRSGGRKLGRTATLAETKRPAYSSYWSVSERNDFARYLGLYGKDWDKLANAMKSKTVIQVRNFYANNEEKMGLKDIANRYNARRKQEMPLQQQPIPPSTQQPAPPPQPKREIPSMGTSFDTSAAHFQALQNFPFPAPIVDQQPIVTSSPHQPPPPPLQAHHRSSSVGSNTKVSSPYANTMNRTGYYSPTPPSARITPSSSSSEGVVYSGSRSYSPSQHHPQLSSRPLAQAPPRQPLLPHQQLHHHQQQQQQQQQPQAQAQPQAEAPSAVTKVADLLNNDDPAEPNQNSWETWFGS
jgi:hypothetical protein